MEPPQKIQFRHVGNLLQPPACSCIEKKQFDILKYLNQNHIRKNSHLKDSDLREQFEFTDHDFSDALNGLLKLKYVDRRTNSCLKITQDGEVKYNELYADLLKSNPIQVQQADEIQALTIENLRLQNKDLKTKIPYGIGGLVLGLLFSLGLQFTQYKFFSPTDNVNKTTDIKNDTLLIKVVDKVL